MLYQEDCLITLPRNLKYDYVFAVPPDFDEVDSDPKDPTKWIDFNKEVFSKVNPSTGIVTIALTDRKFDSRILPKGYWISGIMYDLGYSLMSHKILVKSTGVNLYRLNYTNVYTFGKKGAKQYLHKDFKPDVWMDGVEKYEGFAYGMPVVVPKKCILNYTKPGDVVYDPFMGSGTTAIAAIETGRNWVGSEICKEYCDIISRRIAAMPISVFE